MRPEAVIEALDAQHIYEVPLEYHARGLDNDCLLYTSDAADERSSVDLGGRRIIKKKKTSNHKWQRNTKQK